MYRARFAAWIIVSVHGLKNELDSFVSCSFRRMDYCLGTWIKERVKFMCSVLVSVHSPAEW